MSLRRSQARRIAREWRARGVEGGDVHLTDAGVVFDGVRVTARTLDAHNQRLEFRDSLIEGSLTTALPGRSAFEWVQGRLASRT